jgi:hypothetical protein
MKAQLMARLACMPLSYLPDSLPLRLTATENDATTDGLMLADSTILLDPQAESLTLAMRCAAKTSVPAWSTNLLMEPAANVAVAVSETVLNSVLSWLCTQGAHHGNAQLADGPVDWRWTHLTVTFTDDEKIHLTGQLWRDETTAMFSDPRHRYLRRSTSRGSDDTTWINAAKLVVSDGVRGWPGYGAGGGLAGHASDAAMLIRLCARSAIPT